jgi:hypothetical protein
VFEYALFPLRGRKERLYGDGRERRNNRHQLLRDALGVGDVGDHELRHMCQGGNGFGNVTIRRLLEIEQDRQVVPLPQFVTNGVENGFAFGSEAAKNQENFRCDRPYQFA